MKALNETPINLRAVAVTMTLAALAIGLLAVAMTAGPAWAQGPGGDTGGGNTDGGSTSYPNLSTYPDPQPCGPGAGDAFMQEPHEITEGHYALFDAYWRTISKGERDIEDTGVGVLHTNLCPPEMVKKKKGRTTVITRSARKNGMDVDEAIIHVLDKHMATTSTTTATSGQLSLAEYPRVGDVVSPGDRVWWLRLDDPDTSADETSDLGMGFSTFLLDDERWLTSADGKPMRYRFEVERHPADPTDVPHFFAYEAPRKASETPSDEKRAKLVWDSSKAGKGEMLLNPGEYRALQWVFTKPGTYLLWVHLLGEVKQPGANENWKPISDNETETSEVYRYTIQVGSKLDETEPPIFGVNLSVDENTPGGVKVGDPIPVYNADADVLYYDLTGPGHSHFKLVPTTKKPHAVQVVVAEGASLDYETKSSYDLNLSVTDRLDHEANRDPKVDDVLIVKIDLKDQAPGVVLEVDQVLPRIGETVNFVARYEATEQQRGQRYSYQWGEQFQTTNRGVKWDSINGVNAPTLSVSHSSRTAKTYRVSVELGDSSPPIFVNSNEIDVFWTN